MVFDWHPYVRISHDFAPAERALIRQALDTIARAHDNEGAELIRAAAIHGKPIRLEKAERTAGMIVDRQFHLGMNMDAIAHMVYAPGQTFFASPLPDAPHFSLTGVLVHELYHGGDRLSGKEPLYQRAAPFLLSVLRAHHVPQAQATLRQFLGMYDRYDATYPYLLMTDAFGNRETSLAAFKTHGYRAVAQMLEAVSPETFKAALQRAKILDANGVPRWENDAVAYTDAFMWKNFGSAEPQRKHYHDLVMAENAAPFVQLTVDRLSHAGPGFIADATPALQAGLPRVRSAGVSARH